ncbi:hypothetical protein D3C71_2181640 [compost metagenome]
MEPAAVRATAPLEVLADTDWTVIVPADAMMTEPLEAVAEVTVTPLVVASVT